MEKLKNPKRIEFVLSSDDYAFLKKACFYFGTTIPCLLRTFIQQLRSADWAQFIDDYEV